MASETFTAQIKESKMAEAMKVFIVAIKSNIGCGHGEEQKQSSFNVEKMLQCSKNNKQANKQTIKETNKQSKKPLGFIFQEKEAIQ